MDKGSRMTTARRGFSRERHSSLKAVLSMLAVAGFGASWLGFSLAHGASSLPPADSDSALTTDLQPTATATHSATATRTAPARATETVPGTTRSTVAGGGTQKPAVPAPSNTPAPQPSPASPAPTATP